MARATSAGIKVGHRAAGAGAGVVDDDVRHALGGNHDLEQGGDFLGFGGLAGEGCAGGFLGQLLQLVGVAGGQGHLQAVLGEKPGERGAQARANADNKRGFRFQCDALLCAIL